METKNVKRVADATSKAYHHGDLRSALVRASTELIEREGLQRFTLAAAAKIANVSAAAPYRHFADKADLLKAVRALGFADFQAVLKQAYELPISKKDRLVEIGIAYVRFAIKNPARFRLMFSSGNIMQDDGSGSVGHALLLHAIRAVHPRFSNDKITDLVVAYWSLVHGFATLYLERALPTLGGSEGMEHQLRRSLVATL